MVILQRGEAISVNQSTALPVLPSTHLGLKPWLETMPHTVVLVVTLLLIHSLNALRMVIPHLGETILVSLCTALKVLPSTPPGA